MLKPSSLPNQQKGSDENSFFYRWRQQIVYAWRNVFNDFRQHIFASLLTIIVIAISITLPTIGYLLWKNANEAAHQWNPTPNLTAYISKTLSSQETADLLDKLKALPEVEKVDYMNPDDARKEFRAWSGFSGALDLLDDNPLPAVAIIYPKEEAKKSATLHAMQAALLDLDGIDDVRLDDSWFVRLIALTDMVKAIVWTISIFMIVAVSLVIGNSIRLTISARRQTIIVMQLIGATEGFILRPFLYNGIFIGFISSIFALILSRILIFQIDSIILNVSAIFGTIFTIKGLLWDESLLIILVSMITGWFSAIIATKKYLKILHIA